MRPANPASIPLASLLVCLLGGALGCSQSNNYMAATGGRTTAGAGAASSGSGASSSGSNGTTSGSHAEVSGTAIDTYVGDTVATLVPEDLSQVLIQALVPSTGGGFTLLPGVGTADGGFTIPGVPAGPFLLQAGSLYIYTSKRAFDLGMAIPGRSTVAPITVDPTELVFNISDMTAWQADDQLELHCTNADVAVTSAALGAGNPPDAGATSLSSFTLNLANYPGNHLMDSAEGDSAFLSHLCTQPNSVNGSLRALCEVFDFPPPFDEMSGQTLNLSGSFAPASTQSLALDWGGSQFESLRTAENPSATDDGFRLALDALPGGVQYGAYSAGAYYSQGVNLIQVGLPSSDLDLGTVSYGDPFPASWGLFVQLFAAFAVEYTLPGTESLAYPMINIAQYDASALPSGPLGPLVGPPTAPLVNGQNAFANLSGVTSTPTVSWGPPSSGVASGYQISVLWLRNQASLTTAADIADLYTDGTSLPLPPDVLVSGESYALLIRAIAMPAVDLETSPLRLAFPSGISIAATGILSP